MDIKDKRILYTLDLNARQTNTEIAKKTGVSKQVAGFRIKRFQKEQTITSFYTIVDIAKLGFTNHKNFLRLQNLDQKKENELISFLKEHPAIAWVAACDGKFDLAFGTLARNVEHLDATLKDIYQRFGEYISEREMATIIRGEYFTRDYLVGKQERTNRTLLSFGSVPTVVQIDEVHKKILLALGEDARMNIIDIAAQVQLSADAVSDRIKKLEQAQIIKGYNIVPNESVYPLLHYKVVIGLRNLSSNSESQLQEYCRHHPNIVYIVKSLGPWDFEIDLEVGSIEEFRSTLMALKREFSTIIKDYSTLHIYQVHKYNFCPKVILD